MQVTRRPRGVTVAAILGFVMAALRLLAAALQFVGGPEATWGSVALFYTMGVLNFAVTPFLIWGGVAALKGARSDVLAYSALAVALMEIFGLILAAANGGQTSRGAIALILAVAIFRNLRTEQAKQYFAARSRAGIHETQHAATPPTPANPLVGPTQERGLGMPAQTPPAREPERDQPPLPHEQHPPVPVGTDEERHTLGGQPFGRYQLIDLLGRGGMGEVWRAFDSTTNRMVAIKVLPSHLVTDSTFMQRFRREADAAARLNNPHIIPIHTYGEIDGRLYVDMRLIEGRDLQTVLADGAMEPGRAVRIVEQVAKALHAAHKIGLVHRDVKPSNILLDDDDFAYLIDFGIARGAEETGLTNTGAVIGSWHYMAPERMGGRDVDARSDIYALACVLYECLTGSRPFPGDTLESQVAAHLTNPPPEPSATQPHVPAAFDAVIATGMAKNPDERYASTVEFADAAHQAITTPIPRPTPHQSVAESAQAPVVWRTSSSAAPPHQLRGITSAAARLGPPAGTDRPARGSDRPPWWRRAAVVLPALVALALAVAATVVIVVTTSDRRQTNSKGPTESTRRSQNAPPAAHYGQQTVLPFTGLNKPAQVAVGDTGSVYLADFYNHRIVRVALDTARQTTLPFNGLWDPCGVAVAVDGTVYAADRDNNRVLALAPGSTVQTTLPFTGLNQPCGLAVDTRGTVYVADTLNNRVLSWAAGSATQSTMPLTGLNFPNEVAVDRNGGLYVTDLLNDRVVNLAAGSTTQRDLPFSGLLRPHGVSVDSYGTAYVTDTGNNRVLSLVAGSITQSVLPFDGLQFPNSQAVNNIGTVYVTDRDNSRIVSLSPG
jgi:serine/threonine-protein kinase